MYFSYTRTHLSFLHVNILCTERLTVPIFNCDESSRKIIPSSPLIPLRINERRYPYDCTTRQIKYGVASFLKLSDQREFHLRTRCKNYNSSSKTPCKDRLKNAFIVCVQTVARLQLSLYCHNNKKTLYVFSCDKIQASYHHITINNMYPH